MDINFEHYKIFYFAAKYMSFSEAAGRLYITQSAVSQTVKHLEQQLGEQLFIRKARAIRLTPQGEMLFGHIEQAYNLIKTAEDKLMQLQSLESGEIRIGIGDTICKYFLIPFIGGFTKLYPGIRIQVTNRTSSGIVSLLRNGLIDFGIATLPLKGDDLTVQPFISVQDIFVASTKYSELKGKKVPLKELVLKPLLMLPPSSATRRNIDGFLSSIDIKTTAVLELDSMELLVEFASIGAGIAYVLKESARELIEKGTLFEIDTAEALPSRKLGVAMQKNVPLSRAASEFIKYINSEV